MPQIDTLNRRDSASSLSFNSDHQEFQDEQASKSKTTRMDMNGVEHVPKMMRCGTSFTTVLSFSSNSCSSGSSSHDEEETTNTEECPTVPAAGRESREKVPRSTRLLRRRQPANSNEKRCENTKTPKNNNGSKSINVIDPNLVRFQLDKLSSVIPYSMSSDVDITNPYRDTSTFQIQNMWATIRLAWNVKPTARSSKTLESSTHHTSAFPSSSERKQLFGRLMFFFILFLVRHLATNVTLERVQEAIGLRDTIPIAPNSVYVPGAGFSGFWFTLGRLYSIPREELPHMEYYCYSAGCLATVVSLAQWDMEELYDMARSIQLQWTRGEISRYDVVRTFLDEVLYNGNHPTGNETAHQRSLWRLALRQKKTSDIHALDPVLFKKLHIITSTPGDSFGLKASIRTPQTLEELFEMLLQTTWIPGAIGFGLWHNRHLDGGFSIVQHPTCAYTLGLALDWRLLLNIVNVNLSREGVEKLWNKGLDFGL